MLYDSRAGTLDIVEHVCSIEETVPTENPVRTDLIDDLVDENQCVRRPARRRDLTCGTEPEGDGQAHTAGCYGCGVVGKAGFEPAISRSRTGRDTSPIVA